MVVMPLNLQISSIKKWLIKHNIDPSTVDIKSLVDSTLHYYENLKIIADFVDVPTTVDRFMKELSGYEAEAAEYEEMESPELLRKKIEELESELDKFARKSLEKEFKEPVEPVEPLEKIRLGYKKKFKIPITPEPSIRLEERVNKHLINIEKRVKTNDDKIELLDNRLEGVEFIAGETRRDLHNFQKDTGAALDEILRVVGEMPAELMKEAERELVREIPTPTVIKRVDPKTGDPFWGPDDYAIRTLMTLFPFPGDYYYASPLRQRYGFGQKPLADLIKEELSRPAYLRRVPMPSAQVSRRGLAAGMSMEEIDNWLGMLLEELRIKEEVVEDIASKMNSIADKFLNMPEDILSYGLDILVVENTADLQKEYGFVPDAHSLAVLIGGVGRKFTKVPRSLKYIPEEAASWLWEHEYTDLLVYGVDIAYQKESQALENLWRSSGKPIPSYEELYDIYLPILVKIKYEIRKKLVGYKLPSTSS